MRSLLSFHHSMTLYTLPIFFRAYFIFVLLTTGCIHAVQEKTDNEATALPKCAHVDPIEAWSNVDANASGCDPLTVKPIGDIPNEKERERYKWGEQKFAFDVLASDKIGPRRHLEPKYHELCGNISYDGLSLKSSIVIIYHNEALSVLIRMINSIIDRTPAHLLHEFVLYDDLSDEDDIIGDSISKYGKIAGWPMEKFVMRRSEERLGLIKAKDNVILKMLSVRRNVNKVPFPMFVPHIKVLTTSPTLCNSSSCGYVIRQYSIIFVKQTFAARLASGDVLIFLDSHCEVTHRWIEPLIAPIQEDHTRVVLPIVDLINPARFDYDKAMVTKSAFDWSLKFVWRYLPWEFFDVPENNVKPFKSPIMSGGLLAIQRKFFHEMGEYDTAMEIWGAENVEMSVRMWLCGGSVLVAPCSRVGHVFRMRRPYKGKPGMQDENLFNSLRTVKVWFDDYQKYFLKARPNAVGMDAGDLTERLELKKRLNCKPFSWFIDEIDPDLRPKEEKRDEL